MKWIDLKQAGDRVMQNDDNIWRIDCHPRPEQTALAFTRHDTLGWLIMDPVKGDAEGGWIIERGDAEPPLPDDDKPPAQSLPLDGAPGQATVPDTTFGTPAAEPAERPRAEQPTRTTETSTTSGATPEATSPTTDQGERHEAP